MMIKSDDGSASKKIAAREDKAWRVAKRRKVTESKERKAGTETSKTEAKAAQETNPEQTVNGEGKYHTATLTCFIVQHCYTLFGTQRTFLM